MQKFAIPARENKMRRSDILANSTEFSSGNLLKHNKSMEHGHNRNASISNISQNKLLNNRIHIDEDFKPPTNIGSYAANLRSMRDLAKQSSNKHIS